MSNSGVLSVVRLLWTSLLFGVVVRFLMLYLLWMHPFGVRKLREVGKTETPGPFTTSRKINSVLVVAT